VLSITALATVAQFLQPALLPPLERTPDALQQHQYWRLFTSLFVHSDGWRQIAFNFPVIAVTGYFAERVFGPRLWRFPFCFALARRKPDSAHYSCWQEQ
jgi:membrane associated rhomboid family serine protease